MNPSGSNVAFTHINEPLEVTVQTEHFRVNVVEKNVPGVRCKWDRVNSAYATGVIQFKILTILPMTVSSCLLEFKGF